MKYIVTDILKTAFFAFALVALVGVFGANAQEVSVTDSGIIHVKGQVDTVSTDEFTIVNADNTHVTVKMDNLSKDVITNLIDSNLVKRGTYVDVTGTMEEEFGQTYIDATRVEAFNQ